MTVENRLTSRISQFFKGFAVFMLILTAGYAWLVLQSGANFLNYVAILFGLAMAIAIYFAGSETLLERFDTRSEWAWVLAIFFMFGFQLANQGSLLLHDIRLGKQLEFASLDGDMLVSFVLFIFSLFIIVYSYYRP